MFLRELKSIFASRNTGFFGSLFRPLARHYQFLDSHSNVDFIPKLIEIANSNTLANYGSSNGSFQKGETVRVYKDGDRIATFRLASSNHKTGKFNSPKTTYTTNPYVTSENIPSGYANPPKPLILTLILSHQRHKEVLVGILKRDVKLLDRLVVQLHM